MHDNVWKRALDASYLTSYNPIHFCALLVKPADVFPCHVCLFLSKLSKLELLEELNLSGNKLKTIPSTVSSCKRLHTLIAHSNHITVFPEILNLPEIKVRLVVLLASPQRVFMIILSLFQSLCVLYACSLLISAVMS